MKKFIIWTLNIFYRVTGEYVDIDNIWPGTQKKLRNIYGK